MSRTPSTRIPFFAVVEHKYTVFTKNGCSFLCSRFFSSTGLLMPSVSRFPPNVCFLIAVEKVITGFHWGRRNCKGNPNCLVGIGEQAWLGEIDENAFHNIDDPNSERRDKVFSCRTSPLTSSTSSQIAHHHVLAYYKHIYIYI